MVSIPRLVKLTAIVVMITTTSAEAYSHREGAALGLFTHNVPKNCSATRKCHATHCDCVGGFFLRDSAHPLCSLTDNGNITAATFDRCTSRLVDCILFSALNAHSDPEVLCQRWGDKLVSLYQNTTDELFEVCKADVNYSLVSSTSSLLLADTVNFTLICSFANIKLAEPATSNPPKFDVCMPTDRTYFADFVPVSQCSGAGACVAAYCSCISGVWNAPTLVCDFPSALPTTSKWSSCLRSVTNCLTLAALDVYVPKASRPDPKSDTRILAWRGLSLWWRISQHTQTLLTNATQIYSGHAIAAHVSRFIGSLSLTFLMFATLRILTAVPQLSRRTLFNSGVRISPGCPSIFLPFPHTVPCCPQKRYRVSLLFFSFHENSLRFWCIPEQMRVSSLCCRLPRPLLPPFSHSFLLKKEERNTGTRLCHH
ncbi:Hypothetical protein, putative [Bodo saltans]|uniref:Membrane-associated protein n=1 Tax=Bodo saltans TaxID=75058 RepID=A0A0S4INN5_BODSA|nr:Hypothetical protein, putative [Bodo saltans]|eukprot:CUE91271.1 Hypothetical protein, putative [Bodo saltans]